MFPHKITSILRLKIQQIRAVARLQKTTTKTFNAAAAENSKIDAAAIVGAKLKVSSKVKRRVDKAATFQCFVRKQLFFAQCLKLLVLFTVAVAHIFFLHPFLEFFSHFEEYASKFAMFQQQQQQQQSPNQQQQEQQILFLFGGHNNINIMMRPLYELNQYKKNIWMTVAVLCAALSTTSFFLFLLPSSASSSSSSTNKSSVRKWHIFVVGILDIFAFGCLPLLFSMRALIVQHLKENLGSSLDNAHKIFSAESLLMNEIKCSIYTREKVPLCSEKILHSLFPVDLLKFLMILCALTLAYLLVAYLIYWCIKHWLPHNNNNNLPATFARVECYYQCRCCSSSSPPLTPSSSIKLNKKVFRLSGSGYSPLGGGHFDGQGEEIGGGQRDVEQQKHSSFSFSSSFFDEQEVPSEPIPF